MLMGSIASFVAANGMLPVLWAAIALCLIGLLLPAVDTGVGVMSVSKQKDTFRYLPISQLLQHPRNPRNKDAYGVTHPRMKRLMEDMRDGWDPGHPATVVPARDSNGQRLNDGTFHVLVGNRRLYAGNHLGIESVPCVILTDLSYDEEIRILHDHAQVEGLDDGEKLVAFKDLNRQGLSGRVIAVRLGWFNAKGEPNLNRVNEYRRLAALPQEVQDVWTTYKTGGKDKCPYLPTGENLEALSAAIAADTANRYRGLPEKGKRYQACLESLKGLKTAESENYASKKAMSTAYETEHTSVVLRNLFGVISGKITDIRLSQMGDIIRWMEQETLGTVSGLDRPTIIDRLITSDSDESESDEPETTDVPTPKRKVKSKS